MKSLFGKLGVILIVIGLTIFGYLKVWGADWKIYAESGEVLFFYDAESISRPSKGIVKVWVKFVYKDKKESTKEIADIMMKMVEKGVSLPEWLAKQLWESSAQTIVSLYEIKCFDRIDRRLKSTKYDREGEVVGVEELSNWDHIVPDTNMDLLFKKICA